MTTIGAWPLIELSPVKSPTRSAPYLRRRSPYFWFERAFMGVV